MWIQSEWDGEYYNVLPDDFGNMILKDYWCSNCCEWQMFQFENWGMCDICAMAKAFSGKEFDDLCEAICDVSMSDYKEQK